MYPALTSIFTAWELSGIVSSTAEDNFHSRHFYSFYLQMLIFLCYLYTLQMIYTVMYCVLTATHIFPLAVKIPEQRPLDITWPPESHFQRRDKSLSDKRFCSRRMWPCSLTALAIVHSLVSLSELQGASLPVNILMKVPIEALSEGPKQQGCVRMWREAEMNEMCWYAWGCVARIK